jgi:dienelactone hydrolase
VIVVGGLVATVIGCVEARDGRPTVAPEIRVSNPEPQIDEPVQIQLVGLPPEQAVVLHLDLDFAGSRWVSEASYRSDTAGRVDLTAQAPTSGDYAGVDPMGLFWSARRQASLGGDQQSRERATLVARVGGQDLASTTLWRRLAGDGVTSRPVRDGGLVGTLFMPPGPGPHPALLVLGGSEGGLSTEGRARLYASRGYAALALAYFDSSGLENLPKQLFEIPVEYFQRALEWLRSQPSIDPARVGVSGASRGAEAALLLSTVDASVKVVVAVAPSHVLWPSHPVPTGAAWSYAGRPLPYVPYATVEASARHRSEALPGALVPLFRASLDDAGATEVARIPVEKARAAILLVSGRDDQLWPSSDMAQRITDTLRMHGYSPPYQHLAYDGAGHNLVPPFRPTTELSSRAGSPRGGSAEGSARAAADHWPKLLQFLSDHLKVG